MPKRALATAGLALALAGCGSATGGSSSKSFTGAEKQVSDLVSQLQTAGSRRKPGDICDKIVSTDLRDKLAQGGKNCTAEMKKAVEDADAFDLSVTGVSITGDKATAQVQTTDRGKDVKRTFQLVKQGGAWRISSFG